MQEILENKKELVRLTTAGSVDDGKSTLIGRLLYDCDAVYQDQVNAIRENGDGQIDFALITDGLSSEREQGITIDVAYRYFSTKSRRFIIADVPGHEQYTRNMVTGASNADIAIILVDARKGVSVQSKRHLCIVSLLQIPHVLVLVNKMDAVEYRQKEFEDIQQEVSIFSAKLSIKDLQFIPISALKGDCVTQKSDAMKWYQGRTLLDYLENVQVHGDRNLVDFRFPVQYVVRPNQDFRGYAGLVESGALSIGEEIMVLPSKKKTRVKDIFLGVERLDKCIAHQSVLITTEDEVDISRSAMLVRPQNTPDIAQSFEAYLCWMSDEALEIDKRYVIKHTTNTSPCYIEKVGYRLNVETLHREASQQLGLNDVGKVTIRCQTPLCFDSYSKNRGTGSFIIIDSTTNQTVAAGMIIRSVDDSSTVVSSQINEKKPAPVLWFTGLSGAGKSTIADRVHEELTRRGIESRRLDGDVLRKNITAGLGFDKAGREKNLETAGYLSQMFSEHGVIVLATFITPYEDVRQKLREEISSYKEVYVKASVEVCQQRDVKGLYKKAIAGEIENFTGVSDVFETPKNPDLIVDSANSTIDECVSQVLTYLEV